MKKIAVTGIIGSGKSYVTNMIKMKGIVVLDLDDVAKHVREHDALESIESNFGTSNPKLISKLVFNDPNKLQKLNEIMHPLILKRMRDFFESHSNLDIVVVEVPLLYELGWEKYFDQVWVVACDQKTTIERLVNYRHYDVDIAIKISENQQDLNDKIKKADYVIYNNIDESQESLSKQIDKGLKR